MFIDKHTNSIHTYIDRLYQEDSPEVGPLEILRLFLLSFRTPGLEISTFSRKYLMTVFIGFRQ